MCIYSKSGKIRSGFMEQNLCNITKRDKFWVTKRILYLFIFEMTFSVLHIKLHVILFILLFKHKLN